jgi:hypothetical protein
MGNWRLAGLCDRHFVGVGDGFVSGLYVPAMTAYYNEYDLKAAVWLRGYGNAINAEAAQAFIESVMGTE